jgi:hypothetical protein
MGPNVTVRTEMLIQHLELTLRLKAAVQHLSKRSSRPVHPELEREAV